MKNFTRRLRLGFSLTEALVALLIFIFTIGATAVLLQTISKHNTNRTMRTKAESAIHDALNDLKIKSGTDNSFFYDNLFSGERYYIGTSSVTQAQYEAKINSGGLAVRAIIGNFNAVTQVRTCRLIATYKMGSNPWALEREYNLTASRLASFGGEIKGKIVLATDNSVGLSGVGIMVEAEVGDRFIFAFSDSSGNFFLRGVKLKAPRTLKIFGYSGVPSYYFRKVGDEWDSAISLEILMNNDMELNNAFDAGAFQMYPFGGLQGTVVDGLDNSKKINEAIIQLVPLRTEVYAYNSSKPYYEVLTDKNGEYRFTNLCPGNYLVFMHGSGEMNITKDLDFDFGNKFTQLPRTRGSTFYRGGVSNKNLVYENVITTFTPSVYYAAVARSRDYYWPSSYKNQKDEAATAANYIRVNPGEIYDSNDAVHATTNHKHCNTCASNLPAHKNYFYHPLNTHFKTPGMMSLKGKIVRVEYDSGTQKFDLNPTAVPNFPLRVNSYPHYVYNRKGVVNQVSTDLDASQAMQRGGGASSTYQELGRGGFVRVNYYYNRDTKTESNGSFVFYNLGPRIIEGCYAGSYTTADNALYEANWVRLGTSHDKSYFGTQAVTPLPDNTIPVFVFPFPRDTDLEQFAIVEAPQFTNHSRLTTLVPSQRVFASPISFNYGYGGYEEFTWDPGRPTWSFVHRSTHSGEENERYVDLQNVRVLSKDVLAQVTGQVLDADGNPATQMWQDPAACGSAGTVYTWGYQPIAAGATSGYGDSINLSYSKSVTAANMSYDFGWVVLPSIPNWSSAAHNGYYDPTLFEDGQWGYGNNRIVTYQCSGLAIVPAMVEMKFRFMRKIAVGNGEMAGDFEFYTAAQLASLDPAEFVVVKSGNSPLSPNQVFNTLTTPVVSMTDEADHIVKVVANYTNFPVTKAFVGRSQPRYVSPGASTTIDVHLDTGTAKKTVQDVYLRRPDEAIQWRSYTPSAWWWSARLVYNESTDRYHLLSPQNNEDFLRVFRMCTAQRISGTVTDPDGHPLENAVVHIRIRRKMYNDGLYPPLPCTNYNSASCSAHDQVTGSDGKYSFVLPAALTFMGSFEKDIKIKFKPPAACTMCLDPQELPYNGGVDLEGFHNMILDDVDFQFAPKQLNQPNTEVSLGGA